MKEVQRGKFSPGRRVSGSDDIPSLVLKEQKGMRADGDAVESSFLTRWAGWLASSGFASVLKKKKDICRHQFLVVKMSSPSISAKPLPDD